MKDHFQVKEVSFRNLSLEKSTNSSKTPNLNSFRKSFMKGKSLDCLFERQSQGGSRKRPSFFAHWFRREKEEVSDKEENDEDSSFSDNSCTSLVSLGSTSSFSYVSLRHSSSCIVSKKYPLKNRQFQERQQKMCLEEKYNLFPFLDSEPKTSLLRNPSSLQKSFSSPIVKEYPDEKNPFCSPKIRPYCHRPGKRKAPLPPKSNLYPYSHSPKTESLTKAEESFRLNSCNIGGISELDKEAANIILQRRLMSSKNLNLEEDPQILIDRLMDDVEEKMKKLNMVESNSTSYLRQNKTNKTTVSRHDTQTCSSKEREPTDDEKAWKAEINEIFKEFAQDEDDTKTVKFSKFERQNKKKSYYDEPKYLDKEEKSEIIRKWTKYHEEREFSRRNPIRNIIESQENLWKYAANRSANYKSTLIHSSDDICQEKDEKELRILSFTPSYSSYDLKSESTETLRMDDKIKKEKSSGFDHTKTPNSFIPLNTEHIRQARLHYFLPKTKAFISSVGKETEKEREEPYYKVPTSSPLPLKISETVPTRPKRKNRLKFKNEESKACYYYSKALDSKSSLYPLAIYPLLTYELKLNSNRNSNSIKLCSFSQSHECNGGIVSKREKKYEHSSDYLNQLEAAIANGNHREAAELAKNLSRLRISNHSSNENPLSAFKEEKIIRVNMYVEDSVSSHGPITLFLNPNINIGDLKKQIEKEFEIPVKVQKWIVDQSLADHDDITLRSRGIQENGSNVFLYLVTPDEERKKKKRAAPNSTLISLHTSKETSPIRRGRYWNYEMERWSYCDSDEENEETKEEEPKTQQEKEKEPKEQKKESKEQERESKEQEPREQEEDWEYYYEDVELGPAKAPDLTHLVAALEPTVIQTALETPHKSVSRHNDQKASRSKLSGKSSRKDPKNGWECPLCTLLNDPTRPGCEACTTERPLDYKIPQNDTLPKLSVEQQIDKPSSSLKMPHGTKTSLISYEKLDAIDLIPNSETFECLICFLDIEPGDGAVLRECLHSFCKTCLAAAVEHSDSPEVTCPYKDENYSCEMKLLEREVKKLVSVEVFEKHVKKSLKEASANANNAFHCKTPDCNGWVFIVDNVNDFKCPSCKRLNCITCQAIHEEMNCKQYQHYVLHESKDENSLKTKEWIDNLVKGGDALHCPSCQVLLLKKWGCDWVKCTYCRTEICWVTKQLRWGPAGKGDTSGGCRCLADGRTKCHPHCNYCH